MPLRAIAINCTLKTVAGKLTQRGVECSGTIRVGDHDIRHGVGSYEGDGDNWPEVRRRILEHDSLIFASPGR